MGKEIQISTKSKTCEQIIEHAKKFNEGLKIDLDKFDGVYNVFDLIKTCAARSRYNPDWGVLAGRMILNEIKKTAGQTFSDATRLLKNQLHPDYYDFVISNEDVLNEMVDESRSDKRQSISVATCLKSYLLKFNKCQGCGQCDECDKLWCASTLEYMYMRVATFLCMPDLQMIKDFYTLLSVGHISMATPTMFNAGLKRHQMASCFVVTIGDSLWSIEDFWLAFGEISRNAGGIGADVSRIRHSLIGEVGKSDGIPALLPTYQAILRYVDQSKKRKGSAAIFTSIWHIDIETVIKMKDPKGAESDDTKCLDLSYGVWLNDLFMERVSKQEPWSLFCPKKAPGLTESHNEEFRELYLKYEKEGRARKVIPNARNLMIEIIEAQMSTGMPYLLNSDQINKCNMQDNIGIIRSSNLCVSGDTKILTDRGQIEIQKLVGEKVNVWNGEEFSSTTIHQTGEGQDMVEVTFSNGSILKCTPYHKFYIQKTNPRYKPKNMYLNENIVSVVEAKDLEDGMKIIKCEYPVVDTKRRFPYAYTHGAFCGDGTYEGLRKDNKLCQKLSMKNSAFCKRHINHREYYDYSPTEHCRAKLGNIPRISLYGEKKNLINHIDSRHVRAENLKNDRIDCCLHLDLPEKFKVPINYSLKDKLEWFAGLCDMDGTIARNGNNESLQIGSIHFDFINDVKLMLQTMGCDPKVTKSKEKEMRFMPDGNGGQKKYNCKEIYRLLV